MSDEKRRLAFQMMIRDANKMMRQMGNEGRFTQDDISRHCQGVAERTERQQGEEEHNIRRRIADKERRKESEKK